MSEYLPSVCPIKIKVIRSSSENYITYVKTFNRTREQTECPHIIPILYNYKNLKFNVPYTLIKYKGINDRNITNSSNVIYNEFDGEVHLSPSDIFSTTINGNVAVNKYDLVTVILRELAKILGMDTGGIRYLQNRLDVFRSAGDGYRYITPYLYMVLRTVDCNNQNEVYNYATSGNAKLEYYYSPPAYDLYSLASFERGVSLQYFKNDAGNNETRLLQEDLPKETAIHYIGKALEDVQTYAFWRTINDAINIDPNEEPYALSISDTIVRSPLGTISFSNFINNRGTRLRSSTFFCDGFVIDTIYPQKKDKLSSSLILRNAGASTNNFSNYYQNGVIFDYLAEYTSNDITYPNKMGWTFFLLKKDGSLQEVAYQEDTQSPFSVDFSSITIDDSFARTSDGFLSARLNCNWTAYSIGTQSNYVQYLHIDYKPNKPKLDLKKNYLRSTPPNPDNFYRDIDLVFSNMEGVNEARIVQKEYEDGFLISSTSYNVNVHDGQYIATVDNEMETTFQLISENNYGSVLSNIITVSPLDTRNLVLKTNHDGYKLYLNFFDKNNLPIENTVLTAIVTNIANVLSVNQIKICKNYIDISYLQKGVYGLIIKDKDNNTYNTKFIK